MKLSYVLITHNRREVLLRNLQQVRLNTRLPDAQWEIRLVDNGSEDGTAEAVARQFPEVHLVRLDTNIGMPARNRALAQARGQYVMLLDDDSHPVGDAIDRAIRYLDADATTAAVVGRVVLPDDNLEASAMPGVLIGCATCLRREALRQVGLFPEEFFRQAEEYDLSFRLWQTGWRVRRFEDITFRHNKVLTGRSSALAARMDLRNNLILAARYLPGEMRDIYGDDWSNRYIALATAAGHADAAADGLDEALRWLRSPRLLCRRPLNPTAFEALFEHARQEQAVRSWAASHGIGRVVIADYSKNLYATYRACVQAGLNVLCVADSRPAFAGLSYRGLRVLTEEQAAAMEPEGVVVSNVNPAQVDRVADRFTPLFVGPLLRLWQPQFVSAALRRTASRSVA